MKVSQTFTFIVSRNFGHPITWNVEAWRVYAGGAAAAVLLLALAVLSILYLFLRPHTAEMERNLEELRRDHNALREQIHSTNQQAVEAKTARWIAARTEVREGQTRRLSRVNVYHEESYIPPLRLENFRARVTPGRVEVIFRIVSQGNTERQRGGFLFAVLENQDTDPVKFSPSPTVEVNEKGFPQLYKRGIRFSRVRSSQTYRRRIRRHSQDEYYTHATIYLFSLRGGLLALERYPLDREIFVAGI